MAQAFDYIVVGAGSAGCVMAERLSRSGRYSVLLLEAGGGDRHPLIRMPRGIGRLMGDTRRIWHYRTEPAANSAERPEVWVRGKVLGGSSSVNGLVYNRGAPSDYDALEAVGCTGWNWAAFAPYFAELETGEAFPTTLAKMHTPLHRALLDGGASMGLKTAPDIHAAGACEAMAPVRRTIWRGERWSAARAFLDPARRRPNLAVVSNALAARILFEGRRATGIALADSRTWRAGREVIVTAGGIESPKLLQLSGVGAQALLRSLGIEVVHDAPEVGRNLLDHRCISMKWRVRPGFSENEGYRGWRLAVNAAQYALARSGLMTSAYADVIAYGRTQAAADTERPDVQLLFCPYSVDRSKAPVEPEPFPGITCTGFILRPDSKGELSIRSPDPSDPPRIVPNHLATPHDRAVAVGLVRYVRRLMVQPALRAAVVEEALPGRTVASDAEILSAWDEHGHCGMHLVGACGMGGGPHAVLDSRLRVNGVTGLRVVDASSFPIMIAGNTHAPIMALAARAADLIMEDAQKETL